MQLYRHTHRTVLSIQINQVNSAYNRCIVKDQFLQNTHMYWSTHSQTDLLYGCCTLVCNRKVNRVLSKHLTQQLILFVTYTHLSSTLAGRSRSFLYSRPFLSTDLSPVLHNLFDYLCLCALRERVTN